MWLVAAQFGTGHSLSHALFLSGVDDGWLTLNARVHRAARSSRLRTLLRLALWFSVCIVPLASASRRGDRPDQRSRVSRGASVAWDFSTQPR